MEALLAGVLAALAVAGCGYMAVFMAKALGTANPHRGRYDLRSNAEGELPRPLGSDLCHG